MDIISVFSNLLKEFASKERSEKMAAYLKHKFPFFGVPSPERKIIFTEVWRDYKVDIKQNFKPYIQELWQCPEREYHYFAMDILKKMQKQLTIKDIGWLEELIVTNAWWDSVDFIAPNTIGHIASKHQVEMKPILERWIHNENIWLIRTALIFQLKYKSDLDQDMLCRFVLVNKDSKAFFINKASGWALRQHAKLFPDEVIKFVNDHPELSNLTKREALKHQ